MVDRQSDRSLWIARRLLALQRERGRRIGDQKVGTARAEERLVAAHDGCRRVVA